MINIQAFIKTIPKKPGVYQFLNANDQIIYIGKAKNLKNRVQSYFQNQAQQDLKTQNLLKHIADIRYTEVDSELEAILLESHLIKKHMPKYNVLLKDDKYFVYLKITGQEDFPKFYLTRKLANDKATYIGPKTSSKDIKKLFKSIENLLSYENCQFNLISLKTPKISTSQSKQSLCLIKNIDASHSPCISELSKEKYQGLIKEIIQHFQGNSHKLLKSLEKSMQKHAQAHQFEKASKIRDKIFSIQKILSKQNINSAKPNENLDVFGISHYSKLVFVVIFQIRLGKIINQIQFSLQNPLENTPADILDEILSQYYQNTQDFPKEILIPHALNNKPIQESLLTKQAGHVIKIKHPKTGRKAQLINLAHKNAESYLQQKQVKWLKADAQKDTLVKIQTLLKLKTPPKRIECYDISHLAGQDTSASMVVFQNGIPSKKDYRHFKIKTLAEKQINDYQSIYETLQRRLKYIANPQKGLRTQYKDQKFTISLQKELLAEIKCLELTKDNYLIKNIKILSEKIIPEHALKKLIDKLKPNKIYMQTLNPAALHVGFQKIKHAKYKSAYYKHKTHSDLSFNANPDLIVIDGGKGQLSAAKKALDHYQLKIPIISLSKRLETIHLSSNKTLQLAKNNQALNLIQQLRDEAHRFAISHNRKARIKKLTQ